MLHASVASFGRSVSPAAEPSPVGAAEPKPFWTAGKVVVAGVLVAAAVAGMLLMGGEEERRSNPQWDWPDEFRVLVEQYRADFLSDVSAPWAVHDEVLAQYVERIMSDLDDESPYESETASDAFIDRWEQGKVEAEVAAELSSKAGGGRAAHQPPVMQRG